MGQWPRLGLAALLIVSFLAACAPSDSTGGTPNESNGATSRPSSEPEAGSGGSGSDQHTPPAAQDSDGNAPDPDQQPSMSRVTPPDPEDPIAAAQKVLGIQLSGDLAKDKAVILKTITALEKTAQKQFATYERLVADKTTDEATARRFETEHKRTQDKLNACHTLLEKLRADKKKGS